MNSPKRAVVEDCADYGKQRHNRQSEEPHPEKEPCSTWCRRRKHQTCIHNPALMSNGAMAIYYRGNEHSCEDRECDQVADEDLGDTNF